MPSPADGQPDLGQQVPVPDQPATGASSPFTLGDYIENLSEGAGQGLSENLEGMYQMARHPLDAATTLAGAAASAFDHPIRAVLGIKDSLVNTAQQATSGPAGLGRVLGQMAPIGPKRLGPTLSDYREMTAYHGTPHTFEPHPENPLGKFDLSKIGTGQGAQAYGHGIYVAENPKVAGQYKAGGSLYHVDIPDEHIERMLDWDKPLSEQPHILEAFPGQEGLEDLTGQQLYNNLQILWRSDARASEQLRASGIPGIKYLDAGSRRTGGTRNLVLFDPSIAKIIKKE
jgi:hypothetical protein